MGNTSLCISLLFSSVMLSILYTKTEHPFGGSKGSRFIHPSEISTQMPSAFVRVPVFQGGVPHYYKGISHHFSVLSSIILDAETAPQTRKRRRKIGMHITKQPRRQQRVGKNWKTAVKYRYIHANISQQTLVRKLESFSGRIGKFTSTGKKIHKEKYIKQHRKSKCEKTVMQVCSQLLKQSSQCQTSMKYPKISLSIKLCVEFLCISTIQTGAQVHRLSKMNAIKLTNQV